MFGNEWRLASLHSASSVQDAWKRDPERPKRPLTPWMNFIQDCELPWSVRNSGWTRGYWAILWASKMFQRCCWCSTVVCCTHCLLAVRSSRESLKGPRLAQIHWIAVFWCQPCWCFHHGAAKFGRIPGSVGSAAWIALRVSGQVPFFGPRIFTVGDVLLINFTPARSWKLRHAEIIRVTSDCGWWRSSARWVSICRHSHRQQIHGIPWPCADYQSKWSCFIANCEVLVYLS